MNFFTRRFSALKTQLRSHPKMTFRGISMWPPGWGGSYGPGSIFPVGEQGVLDVTILEAGRIGPRRLLVTNEYLGNLSTGVLTFDDLALLSQVHDVLKACVGLEFSDVGEVELDA